jgi:hypothetical protein
MSTGPTPTNVLIPVLDRDVCIGNLIHVFGGVEAFDLNNQSVGLFETDVKAATALWRCHHGQAPQATEESHG